MRSIMSSRTEHHWWSYAALIIGYGCFLSYFPIGPIGTTYLTELSSGNEPIVFARAFSILATVLVMVLWKNNKANGFLYNKLSVSLSFCGIFASFALLYVGNLLGGEDITILAFAIVFGLASATPKLSWYEAFLWVLRMRGRATCIIVITACFLVAVLLMPLGLLMERNLALSAITVCIIAGVSWICLIIVRRTLVNHEQKNKAPVHEGTVYHIPIHMCVVMIGFGVVWAASFSVLPILGFTGGFSDLSGWGVFAAGVLICIIGIVLFTFIRPLARMPFALMLRWLLVFTGSIFVFAPLISLISPMVACFCYSAIYVLVSVLMIMLILEVCAEQQLTLCTVTTSNYGIFVISASTASILFSVLLNIIGETNALFIITAIGVTALFFTIPLLPARQSKASVLALEKLPEDEGPAERRKRVCHELSMAGGLSERESEVLDLLLDGCSREEVAEQLSISIWTVKNHITNIYSKLGIHSIHELARMASDDESSLI